MTKKEISKLLDIPLTTLNDWQREESSRHKLYEFLRAIPKKEYKDINEQRKNHRIFYVLNRNIDKAKRYSLKDIKQAFSKKDYHAATSREQVIYNKFFKECDPDDLKSLIDLFDLSIRNIKQIYLSSPLRKLEGVREIWDRRFRVEKEDDEISAKNIKTTKEIPPALAEVLNKRVLHV